MATINPFEMPGDDDNDAPSQLIAAAQKQKEEAAPATPLVKMSTAVNMPKKAVPPSQAVEFFTKESWTQEEDYDLCYIWCHFPIEPIYGNDQSGETFWEKVTTNYNTKHPDKRRTFSSVKNRWGKINRQTQCFESQMYKLKQSNPSGMGCEHNLRATANNLFKKTHLPENKLQPHFYQFMHCYDLLSQHEKWNSSATKTVQGVQSSKAKGKDKTQKIGFSSSPGESQGSIDMCADEIIPTSDDDVVRPPGVKAAKKKQCFQFRVDTLIGEARERHNKIMVEREAATAEKRDVMKKLLEIKVRREQDQIMFMDSSGMDEEQKLYLKIRKDEVMKSTLGRM